MSEFLKLDDMKPAQIVSELDKYIIGQSKAKRTIAVAVRNRTRRKRLPESIKDEVSPKNMILIGPTGTGKTELARRISKLSNAPFIKVEASKFTEVGYVGRDVESMIRDLMGISMKMVTKEISEANKESVDVKVENRILDLLLPLNIPAKTTDVSATSFTDSSEATREKFRIMLREGKLEEKEVEISVSSQKNIGIEMIGGANNMDDIQNAMSSLSSMFQAPKKRKCTIKRARDLLAEEESEKMVDSDKARDEAKDRVEQMGIVFIDEIDKIANSDGQRGGQDVSREGVQRDILPIVEGTQVSTKWGIIDTTHILFIASGAFHVSKPSDLIPELQGRFPLRVELDELTADDFVRILTEPKNAITMQYHELLMTEGVDIQFDDEAIRRISEIAYEVNTTNENIGARRLYTVMEKLLEELSFSADECAGQTITITKKYVDDRLGDVVQDQDLSRFIL
ncbi:MAG: ATP-dependent protease ATPase subunit HslU [Spirochaetaceae bacterium]|nr:ATP-dependent protease ATPase subunit HslU [Spirochaetaceae bacterium]